LNPRIYRTVQVHGIIFVVHAVISLWKFTMASTTEL